MQYGKATRQTGVSALRRLGLATALAATIAGAYCATVQARNSDFEIEYVGGTGTTPLLSSLTPGSSALFGTAPLPGSPPPDVPSQSYSNIVAADAGPGAAPETATVPPNSGYSLQSILDAYQLQGSFAFAQLGTGGDGTTAVLLTHTQATSPTVFSPEGPVVLWYSSTGVLNIVVPSTGSGPGDEGHLFTGDMTIYLHSGSILTVAVSPSRKTVTAGSSVIFNSTVTGQSSGETLSYAWAFGDGSGSAQPGPVNHTYLVAGTYDASLKVTGSDDSLGFSQVIPITVGKAPSGPDRTGGGKAKQKNSPDSGASVKGSGGTRKRKATAPAKAGSGAARRSSSGATSSGATATNTKPATSTATKTKTSTATKTTKPVSPHHVAKPRTQTPTGALLSGVPVASVRTQVVRASSTRPGRPGAPDPARSGHVRPPGRGIGEAFWLVLAAVAALVGGALLEWRGRPRVRWRPRYLGTAIGSARG